MQNNLKLLWIAMGGKEDIAYNNCKIMIRRFDELNLKVRKNQFGFFFFMLLYQPLMSPVCLTGYLKELAGTRRRW